MRKAAALLFALTLVAAAAGCSTSSGSDASSKTTTTKVAPTTSTTSASGGTTTTNVTSPTKADVSKFTAADYGTAMVSNLSTGSVKDGQLVIPAKDAACVAPKWVSAVTLDGFHAAGVTPKQVSNPKFDGAKLKLDAKQAQGLIDSFGACQVDIYALFATSLTQGLTADQQKCAVEHVDHKLANSVLVKTFSNGDGTAEFGQILDGLTKACNLPKN